LIVIDEYLAVRVMGGAWPEALPDDEDLALPACRHWRLLQRVHAPGDTQRTPPGKIDLAVERLTDWRGRRTRP
jgi:hypothetical protein